MEGFSPVSPPRIFWNSRKRSVQGILRGNGRGRRRRHGYRRCGGGEPDPPLSDRRRALFEPLAPTNGRISNEDLLPPPDFDAVTYPKGWVVGKKRKLVNVDVVESMRRIAVQEMNRKDREIDGLNEQLEEDSRCLEHLQIQLLEERTKRADVERENAMLHNQISMLMSMLEPEDADSPPENS
ncbi:unnamed protein product [Spirodela intermedia]|uniref:Uncharacterized protein n=1 Tax=Spirodela intermedia TaxID=51605 RepID=A0A7I8IZ06_SPIIN|nr:unnamed protein product [Spirodela intermedia]CAA6662252.1 unnamed protein product [Spirodela intermedia]